MTITGGIDKDGSDGQNPEMQKPGSESSWGRGLNFFRFHLQIGVRVNGVETRDPGNDGPGIGTAHITTY
ncbi:hypothetical protein PABG_11262 [Paracoccidioides brasiliensis Pb03]|nr:hypothetical protein PABG_11262 [Paracoccidioides brasiliensis Pb03]ODH47303.1 hypothetical protein GX48_06589 [Paracoccidioides brasiliensis]